MTTIIKNGTIFTAGLTYKADIRIGMRSPVNPVTDVLLLAVAEVVG